MIMAATETTASNDEAETLSGDDASTRKALSTGVFTPPEYTMKEILDAIPPHCFHSSTLLSIAYILRDFLLITTLILLATQIPRIPSFAIRTLTWALYTFIQGLFFTGVWELAHECGHGALSPSKRISNMLGLTLHSLLLVPYHSWRFTHAQHHKATNNLDRDIAFVPTLKSAYLAQRQTHSKAWEMVEDTPIVALVTLFFHQLIAWPIYLSINNFALERMARTKWWKRSHFYFGGDGPNFRPENTKDVIVSDMGLFLMGIALWGATRCFGRWNVMVFYGIPWLWTNHWILTITFLQHTDASIPYYPTKTWSFLRGAASTVDRDFGFIGRHLFHGAIETHVVHHHSSRIPFYYAAEASAAIRGVMGDHYQSDFETPYMWAFWKNYTRCKYVEETEKDSEIYFFAKAE